jgi:mannose-6-phosphate isomerase-like protein (cupin superfamily)
MLTLYPLQPSTFDLTLSPVALRLHIWQGNSLHLPAQGTHFGYVYQGQIALFRQTTQTDYRLHSGMYFCLPEAGHIEAEPTHGEPSSGIVITVLNHHSMFSLGGPIEPTGRLAYVDGGMNSALIPPILCGAPCLNAMYFPPHVDQILHTHPSDRIGLVVAGQCEAHTPQQVLTLEAGSIFRIPANSLHRFRTMKHNLVAIMFHPDSDTGFSHHQNPMLNRTLIDGVSASELPHIQTRL